LKGTERSFSAFLFSYLDAKKYDRFRSIFPWIGILFHSSPTFGVKAGLSGWKTVVFIFIF
jgi:hypothetical protein